VTDLPGTAADWRPTDGRGTGVEVADEGPGALSLAVAGEGGEAGTVTSRWFPATVPALLSPPPAASAGTLVGSGLDGTDRSLATVAGLPRAPGEAGEAAVVDLDLLRHWGDRAGRNARMQVWFDTEDPAVLDRVTAALARAGLAVTGVRRLGAARAGYDASVPAWSLQLAVLAAVAGLLLAALVLVLLTASTWRRRSRDLACLGLSGVPRRGLRRIAVGEQLPTVLLAVLAGAGCGLAGAAVALPTVPLFADGRPSAGLDLSAPWPAVLAVLAAALVALGAVSWLAGRAVAAAGDRLGRVREPG
jgi:hypothetical protein